MSPIYGKKARVCCSTKRNGVGGWSVPPPCFMSLAITRETTLCTDDVGSGTGRRQHEQLFIRAWQKQKSFLRLSGEKGLWSQMRHEPDEYMYVCSLQCNSIVGVLQHVVCTYVYVYANHAIIIVDCLHFQLLSLSKLE